MDILDQLSREACKAGEYVVKKAHIAKDYTVATWTTAELRAEIEEHYKHIGRLIYQAHTKEIDTAEEVEARVALLEELYQRLREKEEERQVLRHRKLCSACDKPIAKDHAFCPHCGAKVK